MSVRLSPVIKKAGRGTLTSLQVRRESHLKLAVIKVSLQVGRKGHQLIIIERTRELNWADIIESSQIERVIIPGEPSKVGTQGRNHMT